MSKPKNETVEETNVETPQAVNADAAPVTNEEQPAGYASKTVAEIVTPEQLAEVLATAAKAQEHWENFVRATADLDNYRKRAARERQEAVRYANEALLEKLIPVMDNFEAALAAAANTEGTTVQSLKTGVEMIAGQLRGVLRDSGLEDVEALGLPFDPTLHEAVSQQESADVPEGQVLQQLRKGYRLKERLVRPATVIVAKPPVS